MVDKIANTPGKNRRSLKAKRSSFSDENADDPKKTNTSVVGNNPNTPKKQNQQVNIAKTPQNATNPITPGSKKNKKRKSVQASLNNSGSDANNQSKDGSPSPKIQKLQMFPGVNNLDNATPKKTPKSEKQANKKNGADKTPSNNLAATTPKSAKSAKKNANATPNAVNKDDKFKFRHEKSVARRKARRMKYKEAELTLKKGGSVSAEFLEMITNQINSIEARPDKTATSKKKLRYLQKLQRLATGKQKPGNKQTNVQQNKQQKPAQKKQEKGEKQKQSKEESKKKVEPEPMQEESEEEDDANESDEDSSDYDAETTIKVDKVTKKMNEVENESDEEEDDEEEEEDDSAEEEEEDESMEAEEADNDEENDDEDDSEEEEDDDDEEEEKPAPKKIVAEKKKDNKKAKPDFQATESGKSRYIVFVGNLPYEANKADVMEHFKKVGDIQDVRLPTDTKTNKPRGFAYLEVKNEESYQVKYFYSKTCPSCNGCSLDNVFTFSG